MSGTIGTVEERFWAKVEKTDGCWLWRASLGTAGYGQFGFQARMRGAHRVAWELTHGPIPDGLFVRHRCDVKICVRPDHLLLGTQADNCRDMHERGRWHYVPSGKGYRDRLRAARRAAGPRKRGVKPKPLPELIWPKVLITGGCWLWQGQKNRRGYGINWDGSAKRLVHRLVYALLVGPIPDGFHIHHECENHACVNPSHLVALDPSQHGLIHPCNAMSNWERLRAQTHCKRGHEFTPENTRLKRDSRGKSHRLCRTCSREQDRQWRQRRAELSAV